MTQFTCKGVKQINNRISFKHLYHSYLSAFFISTGVPNGEFPEILIAKCRSRFYCTWFFLLGGDRAGGKGVCGRLMSPVQETQSMWEIRLLRGRLPCKGGGLTGMDFVRIPLLYFMVLKLTPPSTIFQYIMAVSFIGGGNQRTRRTPPTCCKSLTNFITSCCIEYTLPWTGFKPTTLAVIDTDSTGSCKSNSHTITTSPAPLWKPRSTIKV